MRKRSFIAALFLFFGISAALMTLGYLTVMYQRAYTEADSQWQRAKMALSRNFMLYGTLVSADRDHNLLVISVIDPYRTDGTITYRLGLLPEAFVGQQDVITPEDGLTEVSSTIPLAPEALWELPAGARLKFLLVPAGNATAISFLLTGNPL